MAAAAAAVSVVVADVPAGNNYTFSALSSTTAPGSTLTASPSAISTGSSASVVSTAKVEALLKLSASFEFEIRGGLFIVTNMPAEAAVVSFRLVYDLDLQGTFRFEICEPRDQGRVVTKVQGQYVYGMAVSNSVTASGAVDLVVEVKASATASVVAQVYECSNVAKCQPSPCEDKCRVNAVAKVAAPVAKANTTAPAKGPDAAPVPVPAPAPAPAPAPVPWKFDECKSEAECYRVQACDVCEVHKPGKGLAPAPPPVDKVVSMITAAPKQDAQPKVSQLTPGQNTPVAPAATNRPAVVSSGSARLVVALNVLAGVVGLALL
ncbi:hypothetical protein OCS_03925 [Ophiocordyceps sinensis CO18]|uniref:Uncharacterized protein n=1 Tax=Ophiocordyceps sinensis (strain Co18 / CGMCC 3.14243) TaxID=911162 RepID=T5AD73_OPHSC|nr:hypothetical protein OCS_03925 [Ophiocordyceps sinensis CO18]